MRKEEIQDIILTGESETVELGRFDNEITISDGTTVRGDLFAQIATIFKEAGLIEKYGSGIKRIVDNLTVLDLPIPKLEDFQHGFKVTVFAKTDNDTDNDTGTRSKKIIRAIQDNNQVSTKQLVLLVSVSKSTILRDLDKLKKSGILKRVGSAKSGHWEVTI